MIELQGKYATAKVFTDVVDNESISQVIGLLNQPYAQGSKIRMMPDIHAGAGCTIGTTMTITDKVNPGMVGVDIGCGMLTLSLGKQKIDFKKLDDVIREYVPSGFSIHDEAPMIADFTNISHLRCAEHVDLDRGAKSIGTLGGGNHFIEVDSDDDGNMYLVIHSGSRNLGKQVAEFYQNMAFRSCNSYDDGAIQTVINTLKMQNRQSEISDAIKKIKAEHRTVPKDMAYVTGNEFESYIHDMKIMQDYATTNRSAIAGAITVGMGWEFGADCFETVHNYIDTDSMILRKGAVSARLGERLLIPMNMRDGSLICRGKGNPDWNFSAPHGAGRIMSRSAAKETVTLAEFEKSMEGIYTTSVGLNTIDESPMAYKKMEDIVNNIGPTVTIEKIIKPVYNFKAG